MIELLNAVDKPGVIDCSCILKGKDVIATSFPEKNRNHQTIAKQAFSYVFLNVSKVKSKHDEAHLEVGEKRLSAFLLRSNLILVCMSAKDSNIQQVRNQARQAHAFMVQEQLQRKSA
ncbi:hypothetical protein [Neptuniibacter sp.]|uniref:hypothetical protein n=1 Tax=Neptuniibacter sp. TaxID=1962643 RepID=UPI00261017DC|nr:hypothetical protein [Neptuniibacter sp.]MCP4598346.1 hypothetical protein [Neptuniibacter sp.]